MTNKRRKNQQNKQAAAAASTSQQQPAAAAQTSAAAAQTVADAAQTQNASNTQHAARPQEEEAKEQQAEATRQKHSCDQCSSNVAAAQQDGSAFSEGDDPMMVQPKFNISETVEVVHMGQATTYKNNKAANNAAVAQQQAQRFANQQQPAQQQQQQTQTKAQPAAQQKQGTVWNQPAASQTMGASQYKRQYQHGSEPYGKQPVVTMHDLIDQEQQKAQRQQQQQQQSQVSQQQTNGQQMMAKQPNQPQQPQQPGVIVEDMGVEADDEEGEEESEEEDTEEEGLYGPEEGHEDDLSDEIEDEQHQWTTQTQAQNAAAQYRQPGAAEGGAYPNQPAQPGAHGNYQQPQDGSQQYYAANQGATNTGQHPQQYQGAANQTQSTQANQQQQHYQQQNQQPQQNTNTQGHQQQQQRTPAQQSADNVETRLHQYLTDMLINLYNGKGTEEYRDHYAQVVTILDDQKKIQELNREQPSITINALQQLFETKIENIVGTVRDKLQEDAKKDNLVVEIEEQVITADNGTATQDVQDSNGSRRQQNTAANTPTATTTSVQKVMKAKEYRGDLQKNFDEILSAVGDYFDLFKNNTDKLEALWLQLLDFVAVRNQNQCRIFRRMHYSIYIRTVIKNKTITAIINEAKRWNNTPHASKALKEHLDKIKQIENDSHPIPETYENFNKRQALDFDLNEYTRTDFSAKQQQLERQQQANSQQQMRGSTQNSDNQGANNANYGACKNTFTNCDQFTNHQRAMHNGKCMCRCQSHHCKVPDHQFLGAKGQRNAQQKRATDKRQAKKYSETSQQSAEFDYADEQVYNKNIDDLMDYIMQPQQEGSKKNKKKAKKRKGANDEEEAVDPKQASKMGNAQQPNPVQQQTSSASSKGSQQPISNQPPSGGKTRAAGGSKQRKQNSASSGGAHNSGSSPEKDAAGGSLVTGGGAARSTSRTKPAKSDKPLCDQPQDRHFRHESQPPQQVNYNSDLGGIEEKGKIPDEEFEAELADFAKQLERNCVQKLANHAKKLRPNYEDEWILKLKLRLQNLDLSKTKHPASSTQSSSSQSSQSKTAPPASGHGRKH